MGSDLVVMLSPVFDHDLRINSITEPLHRQALVAELAVEGFIHTVLPGLTGIDGCRADILLVKPSQDRSGDELRAVVGAKMLGRAVNADQHRQHLDDPLGADTPRLHRSLGTRA